MVIRELIHEISHTLKQSGNDNALFEAHLIVRKALSLSPLDIVLKSGTDVPPEKLKLIYLQVNRRALHEPLEYILGTQEFMGLEFSVNPSVLIPRHDTERLAEHILEHFGGKAFTALDLCTGSGCIAVSLAYFNKNAHVTGIDISPEAIEIAMQNAQLQNVSDRVKFRTCDIFKSDFFGKYDLIVSNPPYIESDVIPTLSDTVNKYEPHQALDGGADGLDFYRHITKTAPRYLSPGGMLAFEIGYNQKESVSELMEASFRSITALKDYGDNYRVISGILK